MKILKGLIFFFFLATTTMAQENTNSYNLKQCLDFALENSDNMKNANLDVDAAIAEIGRIRSAGLPQVNAGLGLNWNYELRKSLLPAETFGGPAGEEVELAFGTKYDGDVNIGFSQLLFDGSYFVGLQAARMYKLYSEQQRNQTKIEVVDAVTKSYYLVLINMKQFDQLKSNEERLQKLLEETDQLYQTGFAEKIDVSRIRVSLNNITVTAKSMERLIDLSKYFLKLQMGLDVEEPITLAGKIEDLPQLLGEAMDESGFNYNSRIDYQILQTGRSLQELDLKNNQVQYLPNLYLQGAYGRNTNTNDFDNYFDFGDRWLSYGLIGVQLNVPVFDGLRKSYNKQKLELGLKKVDNQRNQLENSIDTELKQKRDDLTNSLEMMSVQKQNYDLALEIYETTNTKYQEGLGSNFEVVEANTSLVDAQTLYYSALYNAVVARVELEKALGLYNQY